MTWDIPDDLIPEVKLALRERAENVAQQAMSANVDSLRARNFHKAARLIELVDKIENSSF